MKLTLNPLILLSILAAHFAVADNDDDKSIYQYSSTGNTAPGDIDPGKWPQLMANPDREVNYSISGYNTSQTYPGHPLSGWKITVSVKEDISAENMLNGNQSGLIAASLYRLNPPRRLVEKTIQDNGNYSADSSWGVSITYYVVNNENSEKLNDDNGSCRSLLSDDCITQLQNGDLQELCFDVEAAGFMKFRFRFGNWSDEIETKNSSGIDWYQGSELLSAVSDRTDKVEAASIEMVGNLADVVIVAWNGDHNETEGVKNTVVCPRVVKNTGSGGEDSGGSSVFKGTPSIFSLLLITVPTVVGFFYLPFNL